MSNTICACQQIDEIAQGDSETEKGESPPAESHALPNNEMYRVDEHGDVTASFQYNKMMNSNFATEQFPTRYLSCPKVCYLFAIPSDM